MKRKLGLLYGALAVSVMLLTSFVNSLPEQKMERYCILLKDNASEEDQFLIQKSIEHDFFMRNAFSHESSYAHYDDIISLSIGMKIPKIQSINIGEIRMTFANIAMDVAESLKTHPSIKTVEKVQEFHILNYNNLVLDKKLENTYAEKGGTEFNYRGQSKGNYHHGHHKGHHGEHGDPEDPEDPNGKDPNEGHNLNYVNNHYHVHYKSHHGEHGDPEDPNDDDSDEGYNLNYASNHHHGCCKHHKGHHKHHKGHHDKHGGPEDPENPENPNDEDPNGHSKSKRSIISVIKRALSNYFSKKHCTENGKQACKLETTTAETDSTGGFHNPAIIFKSSTLEGIKEVSKILSPDENDESCEYDVYWAVNAISCSSKNCGDSKYIPNSQGEGVYIYVVDTGINKHSDFGNRIVKDIVMVDDGDTKDYISHGTLTSGLAASSKLGIAKKAKVVSVKVFDKWGNSSIEYIANGISELVKYHKANSPNMLGVVNFSLVFSRSEVLQDLISKLPNMGLIPVAAAGNSSDETELYVPARLPVCITAASISEYVDDDDAPPSPNVNRKCKRKDSYILSKFSNYGPSVDVLAPGENVTSTCGSNDYCVASGTSFSSPLTAGITAVAISENPKYSPDDIKRIIVERSRHGLIDLGLNIDDIYNGLAVSRVLYTPNNLASTNVSG